MKNILIAGILGAGIRTCVFDEVRTMAAKQMGLKIFRMRRMEERA